LPFYRAADVASGVARAEPICQLGAPMAKLIVTGLQGNDTVLDGKTGMSVMENIRQSGNDELLALCGGAMSCATCHVYVDPCFADLLPPMSPTENELLDFSEHRQASSRLSCQIPFEDSLDGLKVTIAPDE